MNSCFTAKEDEADCRTQSWLLCSTLATSIHTNGNLNTGTEGCKAFKLN